MLPDRSLEYFEVYRQNIYTLLNLIWSFVSWKTLVYQILIDFTSGSKRVSSTYVLLSEMGAY